MIGGPAHFPSQRLSSSLQSNKAVRGLTSTVLTHESASDHATLPSGTPYGGVGAVREPLLLEEQDHNRGDENKEQCADAVPTLLLHVGVQNEHACAGRLERLKDA